MKRNLLCKVMLLVIGTTFFTGCGSAASAGPKPESFVSVKGAVTMDNKPLEGAMVIFFPQDAMMGDGANAITDASGNFELTTGGASGAVPGNYRVLVSRLVDPSGRPVIATPDTPPANLGAIESLPSRYSDYTQSVLKSKVAQQGGTFDFKLTSR